MGEHWYSLDKYSRHLCSDRPTLLSLSSQCHRSKHLPTGSAYGRFDRDYNFYGGFTSDFLGKHRSSSLWDRNDQLYDYTTSENDFFRDCKYHRALYKPPPSTSVASVSTTSPTYFTSDSTTSRAITSVTSSLRSYAISDHSHSFLLTRDDSFFERSARSSREFDVSQPPSSRDECRNVTRLSSIESRSGSSDDERNKPEVRSLCEVSVPDIAGFVYGDGTNGLSNLGNTCFMNSILQCLSHTVKLRDYSLRRKYDRDCNENARLKGKLFKAFAEILNELWSNSNRDVAPSNLKAQVEKFSSRFAGSEQHDSQEFLRFLLDGLHEEINQNRRCYPQALGDLSHLSAAEKATETWKWYESKDKSYVIDLFVGQLQSSLKCVECQHESLTYDPFWDLSLPISSAPSSFRVPTSLEACLETFTKEEILDGEDKPVCAFCKEKRSMKKKLLIHRFPQILVIHLKRFKEGKYRHKLDSLVDFPVQKPLDLRRFATNICDDSTSSVYQLYAVSNHSGTSYSGHYTAFCQNQSNKTWHDFNDAKVRRISEDAVCSRDAYVLFYAQKKKPKKYLRFFECSS